MKRYLIGVVILICAGCLWSAQTTPSSNPSAVPNASPQTAATPEVTPSLPGNTVVITIKNVCATNMTPCETKITKDEFDKLFNTVAPKNAPPQARTAIAERYVEFLTFANAAKNNKLDQTPEFEEQLELAKLQILAQAYQKKLQEDASQVSNEELKKYYDENSSKYDEITVRRIMIPRVTTPAAPATPGASPSPTVDPEKRKAEEEAATKAIAQKAQKRLAAGEDPDQVQKDAYVEAKSQGSPPSTAPSPRRRGAFPASEESKIFDLKAGEVSEPLNSGWGYEIYKVESKRKVPLESVQDEIKRNVSTQRMKDTRQQLLSSSTPEYNSQYFTTPPSSANPMTMNPGTVKPVTTPTPAAAATPAKAKKATTH